MGLEGMRDTKDMKEKESKNEFGKRGREITETRMMTVDIM